MGVAGKEGSGGRLIELEYNKIIESRYRESTTR